MGHFGDRVMLHRSGWSRTYNLPTSASSVLSLQVCASTPGSQGLFLFILFNRDMFINILFFSNRFGVVEVRALDMLGKYSTIRLYDIPFINFLL